MEGFYLTVLAEYCTEYHQKFNRQRSDPPSRIDTL